MSFVRSLVYYDSAQVVADRSRDTLLMAEAFFAKGRVYDAWNKQPRQTIHYFTQAARLFRQLPGSYNRYVYTQHLVAHGYDKIKDSLATVRTLTALYGELIQKDTSLLRQLPCTAEMALIATEVRSCPLAQKILSGLTRRSWIRNDANTYNYLDHYYLTQSRLDAFWRKPRHSFYLDSLQQVFRQSTNPFDKLYYAECLAPVYTATKQYEKAAVYYSYARAINQQLNNSDDINSMQQALLRSEVLAEKQKLDYLQSLQIIQQIALWVLSGLLAVITLLSVFLYKRNITAKRQADELVLVNSQLDDKITQVELLNKEIQHRVKNNLQIIYSLLQMQERKTDNAETISALQTARLRIDSMAALHQQLLSNQENLDLRVYLKTLVTSVVNFLSHDRSVVTHMAIEPVLLPVSHYLPLSLVLNEWVTNSMKYAHTLDKVLEISLSMWEQDGMTWLTYTDNGRLPEDSKPPGLGLQIVKLLANQMKATLRTDPASPYQYRLGLAVGKA